MTKTQVDPRTGDTLPLFGVEGGTAEDTLSLYKKVRGPGVEENALFLIKANAPLNTEIYGYTQSQMSSGRIKFLIDEQEAKSKLMATKLGQGMTPEKRNEYLKPFTLTTILKEQMMNLIEQNEGVNIILKKANNKVGKDKFSAFIYGLYYVKKEEDTKRRRRKTNFSDLMFFS